ncbi:unnamed protein product [Brassica oleracea var. botrytis]
MRWFQLFTEGEFKYGMLENTIIKMVVSANNELTTPSMKILAVFFF